MAKKKLGRPTKLDVETMNKANIGFIIIIIILLMLLSVCMVYAINPRVVDMIKASLAGLFK